jgi:hypothetical protein
MVGAFLAVMMIYILIMGVSFGAAIITVVATWKLNEKAGEPGWHSIIPFLCVYTRAKIGGAIKYFWRMLITMGVNIGASSILGVIMMVIAIVTASPDSSGIGMILCYLFYSLVNLGLTCVMWYFWFKIEQAFAKAFGKDTGYALGLIFLPFVFNPLLVWGKDKAEYIPPVDIE